MGWSWWPCHGCCCRREAGHQGVLLRMEAFTALERLALNSQINGHSHWLTCPWSPRDIFVNVHRPLKPGVRNLSPLLWRYSCILHFLSTPSSPSTVSRFVTLYDVQHRREQGHFTEEGEGGGFQNYVSLNLYHTHKFHLCVWLLLTACFFTCLGSVIHPHNQRKDSYLQEGPST